jgi:NAD(P)H-flavin reductase
LLNLAHVKTIETRTPSVRVITFEPETPLPYIAGQYISLQYQDFEPRYFSVANMPRADNHITLHIRDTGAGLSHALFDLKIGDTVLLGQPQGMMLPEYAANQRVLMVAGGTGITPMLALAQSIIRYNITTLGITIVYGVRDDHDIYCKPEIDALLATGEVTVSYAIGVQTPDLILQAMDIDYTAHAIYISGPLGMVHATQDILYSKNADPNLIFTDAPRKIPS